MSTFHHYPRCFVAGAVVLSALTLVFEAGAQTVPRAATVMSVHGKARFSTDQKTWQPVRNGSMIGGGTLIQTADNSTVDLRLGEGETADTVEITPNAILAIDRVASETPSGAIQNIELDLRAGEITGQARNTSTQSIHEIKFSQGVAGVRETGSYRITASGRVDAITGSLVVAFVDPTNSGTATVTAGQRLNPETWTTSPIPANASADMPPSKAQPASAVPIVHTNAVPVNPALKGPGMGGSLRKF